MPVSKFNLEYFNYCIDTHGANGVDGYGYENIKIGFDNSPDEFLKFAEYDSTAEYDHHLVNSLSNSKRAIDSQLDSLLIAFGLSKRAKNWHFPEKINYLNSIGIISPRILNKINKKRNLLEHEYKNPNKEEVEDALDVAQLFVAYTNKYLFPALKEYTLWSKKEGHVTITLDWENCKFISTYPTYVDNEFKENITEDLVVADQKDYDEYLKFYLTIYKLL
jgi:hypothetical protein